MVELDEHYSMPVKSASSNSTLCQNITTACCGTDTTWLYISTWGSNKVYYRDTDGEVYLASFYLINCFCMIYLIIFTISTVLN